jgi:hypothetical protein
LSLESLSQVELIQVTFSLIFVVISLILGFRILSKYFGTGKKIYITVGLTWVFLSSAWWGNAISLFTFLLMDVEIPVFWDLFLGNIFLAPAVVLWVYSFCYLIYPQLKKKLLSIYLVICATYEIFLIIFFFIDLDIIGRSTARFNTEHNLYPFIFQIFAILTALISGILVAKASIKSDDKKVKAKGWFLLLGFLSFTIAAIFDAAIPMDAFTLVIIRTILILSAFEYYLGFLLPKKLANWITGS